jgi:hypothetical protein
MLGHFFLHKNEKKIKIKCNVNKVKQKFYNNHFFNIQNHNLITNLPYTPSNQMDIYIYI